MPFSYVAKQAAKRAAKKKALANRERGETQKQKQRVAKPAGKTVKEQRANKRNWAGSKKGNTWNTLRSAKSKARRNKRWKEGKFDLKPERGWNN